jgi:hypothetical protein
LYVTESKWIKGKELDIGKKGGKPRRFINALDRKLFKYSPTSIQK